MNNQLSNISTQYRKFSKGQYIEHPQFNEFLDFFEDQDRLSRVMLQGVGIVCGLKPKLIYVSSQLSSIQLSQGVALTTDGDLLTLNRTNEVSKDPYVSDLKTIKIETENYTHFKAYDNYKVKYPAFHDENGRQIEIWELATILEPHSDFQPISNLSNLDDKYLLLYLENYEKEVKPCRGVDCDNHGVQQIRNLKVLVSTAKGINHILEKDQIQPHPLFINDIMGTVKQERVIVERLILKKGVETHFSSSDLKELYSAVLEKNNFGKIVFEKINAISRVIGIPTVDHQRFVSVLEKFLTQKIGFQYAFDVVQDLMDTYSEIIKLLPKAFTQCLPDLVSFPKHIMLGKLISYNQLDSSRHQFYNSPVLDDEQATQKVNVLINRFNQQVQNFKYFTVFDDHSKGPIKITPSQKLNPLSNKAIPFYYEVTEEFLKAWNFDKTGNRSFRDNLAYDTWLSSDPHIQDPISFNIDENSFYNIEGHQGMNYQNVFQQIKQIREKKNLGFDMLALSLDELVNNKDLFKAYFNEYVEKNPGLEHKRGVERGGTFIVVYESQKSPKVIADFSLPYICCTPKIEVKLSLPNTVICAKSDPIPFTVFPVNGDVEAVVDADLNGGVELIDGHYFFNPAIVSSKLYDQEITFTVNGKLTNCSIMTIAPPDVDIAVDSVFYSESDPTATIVNFIVSGQHFTDYTYGWDFWDNGSFVILNPDAKGNISHTFYDLIPTRIPMIKVNVSGNGCTQYIALKDWHSFPSIVINNISFPKGNCCEDSIITIAANAGGRKVISLPTDTIIIKGWGLGASRLKYSWTQIYGPKAATLTGADQPDLTAKDLVEGLYRFQLTVTDADSGVLGTDVAEIQVFRDVSSVVAHAGGPKTISLPKNSVTLEGAGSGASKLTYLWAQLGDTKATLTGINQPVLTVTDLVAGSYKFQLTVTNADNGLFAVDVAEILVLPATSEIEVVVRPVYNPCEVGMVVKVNVPKGEIRVIKVFKKGITTTTEFKNYTGIREASNVIVVDGFVDKIEATTTFGMFLNVNGFMYGSESDRTILTLQVTSESGSVYDEIELKADHNAKFNNDEMNRCLS